MVTISQGSEHGSWQWALFLHKTPFTGSEGLLCMIQAQVRELKQKALWSFSVWFPPPMHIWSEVQKSLGKGAVHCLIPSFAVPGHHPVQLDLSLADGSQLTNWTIFPSSGEWNKAFQLSSSISEPLQNTSKPKWQEMPFKPQTCYHGGIIRSSGHISFSFLPNRRKLQLWGACTVSKPTQQPRFGLANAQFHSVMLATSDSQHTWTSWAGSLSAGSMSTGTAGAQKIRLVQDVCLDNCSAGRGVFFSAGYKADLEKGGQKKKKFK